VKAPAVLAVAGRDDHLEQLHLAILELVEGFGMAPSVVRRYVNLTLRGDVPAPIRDRAGENPDGPGGYRLTRFGSVLAPSKTAPKAPLAEADRGTGEREPEK
jgi:hypothetical protein